MDPHDFEGIRNSGRNHLLSRLKREYPADAVSHLVTNFDSFFQVRPTTEPAAFIDCDVSDLHLPISGGVARVSGRPVISSRTDHGMVTLVGWCGDRFEIGFDLWATLGGLLFDMAHPERTENVPAPTRPTVDLLEDKLFAVMSEEYGARNPIWPGGSRFALGLSHDVDRIRKTFQKATHAIREFKRGRTRRALHHVLDFGRDSYWCFPQVMAIERQLGVRSTFFFLHEVAEQQNLRVRDRVLRSGACRLDDPRVREIVPELRTGGWEIGLHSSSFARNNLARLVREKRLLEDLSGGAVKGVRQHFLDPYVSRLWPLQRKAGFDYDSTMGYSTANGFRAGTCFPFIVGSDAAFCQIPFEVMDGAVAPTEGSWNECSRILQQVEAVGGVLVLLWHQRFFNSEEFPGYADMYRNLVVEAIRRKAWIAPLGDVVRFWRGLIS